MKKGMKKMKLTANCKNACLVFAAIADIDLRTKTGIWGKTTAEDWNGMGWRTQSFYAVPDEVENIREEIETEYGVKFI